MKFEDIQELKKNKKLVKNNINFAKVMAVRLYPEGWIYTLKCLIFSIVYRVNLTYVDNSSDILLSYNFNEGKRKDYDYIINKMKKIIGRSNELKINYGIYPARILHEIKMIVKKLYLYRNLDLSFSDKIRVSALDNCYDKVLNELGKIEINVSLYISFCDSYLEENLVAQYLGQKDIITATLQHGQYLHIKKGSETKDAEGYLNFVSDYLFSWGEVTKLEFLKANIQEERILTLGALKEFSNRNIIKNNSLSNQFGLILNGETHASTNIKMIEISNRIAEKYSLSYFIRPHPMNNMKKYLRFVDDKFYLGIVDDTMNYGNNLDFSILNMTGVFVELLSNNAPFFVFYDDGTEDIFKIDMIKFENISEFHIKYQYLNNNKETFLQLLSDQYYRFNCCEDEKELISNYSKALENILGRKLNE